MKKIGFINSIKQDKLKTIQPKRYQAVGKIYGRAARVKSVEITEEWVDMYDVVNSETGQFMANGMIVHNSSADIIKRALPLIYEALKPYDASIVNCVHDEIVIEAAEGEAAECAQVLEREMRHAGQEFIRSIPVTVDVIVSDTWQK